MAQNKFKILILKGEWNSPSKSEDNVLSLQAEIQNLKKSTMRENHNENEPNPKKTHGKDYMDNPTWLNKNIKPEYRELKIRT